MPAIRLIVLEHRALLTSSIALNGEIINPCSHCIKKGLVYVAIADLSSRQPSSYSKCIKLNTYASYDVHSVFFNKYYFFAYFNSL